MNKIIILKNDTSVISIPHSVQFNIISRLYLSAEGEVECDEVIQYKKEIKKKLSGYKHQDIIRGRYENDKFISLEQTVEKLLCSKLACAYCKCKCDIIYDFRNTAQWTLDRICNDEGHNTENVIISCLKCNIKRGTMDHGRYKKGKQLKCTLLDK